MGDRRGVRIIKLGVVTTALQGSKHGTIGGVGELHAPAKYLVSQLPQLPLHIVWTLQPAQHVLRHPCLIDVGSLIKQDPATSTACCCDGEGSVRKVPSRSKLSFEDNKKQVLQPFLVPIHKNSCIFASSTSAVPALPALYSYLMLSK